MGPNHHCEECIYSKECNMSTMIHCEKHNEFVERTRIPESYNCSFYTRRKVRIGVLKKGEKK